MADCDSTPSGRICTKCGIFKSWEEFTKAAGAYLGRSSRCRACAAAYAKQNRARINELSLARYHRLQAPKREAKERAKSERIGAADKRCSKCCKVKPKTKFGPDKSRIDGLRQYCRACKAAESRQYRERNPETSAKASADWAKKNPERRTAQRRTFQSKHTYRVMHAISTRIYLLLKGKKSAKTQELIGYTAQELIAHLERQFSNGMSWDNYGEWHVDHIRPLSSFKDSTSETIRQAWALTNLRPLWAEENLKKNARITHLI